MRLRGRKDLIKSLKNKIYISRSRTPPPRAIYAVRFSDGHAALASGIRKPGGRCDMTTERTDVRLRFCGYPTAVSQRKDCRRLRAGIRLRMAQTMAAPVVPPQSIVGVFSALRTSSPSIRLRRSPSCVSRRKACPRPAKPPPHRRRTERPSWPHPVRRRAGRRHQQRKAPP